MTSAVIPGHVYRDGMEEGPSPYLRWGIVEDVYEHDVSYPATDEFGNRDRDIPLSYARSVTVKWLHNAAGRSTVKFIEPWGVTSMPMKGSVVVVGFVGGPGGEPVILGFWTQGYAERLLRGPEGGLGTGELGPGLKPGQEIWRRSGWRLRVVPYYSDVRKFPEQYMKSPWVLDLIAGEQADQACFCAKCQTRYPSSEERNTTTGELELSCPTTCPTPGCSGKPILVSSSVASGQGDAWLVTQSNFLVETIMKELSDLYDENILGGGIQDIRLQVEIQKRWKHFRDTELRREWGREVLAFFESQLVSYWEKILREYFTVGNLLSYAHDAPIAYSPLVALLSQYVEGWLYTHLTNYLMVDGRLTEVQRNSLMESLGRNLKTYILDYTPRVIEQMCKQAIMNKVRVYITDVIARLRRQAVNWLQKTGLKKAKDAVLGAISDQLDKDWAGFRWVRDAAGQLVADLYDKAAALDLANLMKRALAEGLEDPEELPIFELRGDQDIRSVLNPASGREEGQGDKASRFRLKIYRDGELHIQVQEGIYLYFRADGTFELDCQDIDFTADSMHMLLRDPSSIVVQDTLYIGNPMGTSGPQPFKKVTLDEDNVREYDPVAGISTREFVERVAWKYVAGELGKIFRDAAVAPGDGGTTLKTNVAARLIGGQLMSALGALFGSALPSVADQLGFVPDNSIIGTTEASAEHLEGN